MALPVSYSLVSQISSSEYRAGFAFAFLPVGRYALRAVIECKKKYVIIQFLIIDDGT